MPLYETRRIRWAGLDETMLVTREVPKRESASAVRKYGIAIELSKLAADPIDAITGARRALELPFLVDAWRCGHVALDAAELSFGTPHGCGELRVSVRLPVAVPFPFTPWPAAVDAALSFDKALMAANVRAAVLCAGIEETKDHWWFPAVGIGSLGVVVDKRSGAITEFGTGHGSPLEGVWWAYRNGLMVDGGAKIHVTAIHDRDAGVAAVAGFAGCSTRHADRVLLAAVPATVSGRPDGLNLTSLWRGRDALAFEVVTPEGAAPCTGR